MICTANICRSPVAEALMQKKISEHRFTLQVSSAGIKALNNRPADTMAQRLLLERGIDLSLHRSKAISSSLLLSSDLILVMEQWHTLQLEHFLPSVCGRVFRLGQWKEYDILDPFQRGRPSYENALELIELGIEDWLQNLGLKPSSEVSQT